MEVAAHLAAQLPELLRGVVLRRLPQKYDRAGYLTRFTREARVHDSDVVKAARIVTAVARRHMSAGVVAQEFGLLLADLRELLEPTGVGSAATQASSADPASTGGR